MGSPSIAAVGEGARRRVVRVARSGLGALADTAGRAVATLPGALGALSLAYGGYQIYHPLFWIIVGAAGLLIDRRTAA